MKRKIKLPVILVVVFIFGVSLVNAQQKTRVACIGNSITAGGGVKDMSKDSYPAQLQNLLGDGYEVMNFGEGSATALKKGNHPYWDAPKYQLALQSQPNLVFIKLGTNDSKAPNRPFMNEFEDNLAELVKSFKKLPSKPKVVLMLPLKSFITDSNYIYDPYITSVIIPHIQHVAKNLKLQVIDLHTLFEDKAALLPDKIHPNTEGYGVLAQKVYQFIMDQREHK